jgi:hypothetical protein
LSNGATAWFIRAKYWPVVNGFTTSPFSFSTSDHVDLAADQRGHGGLRVGDVDPLDALEHRDLAACEARRRLGAGTVLRVLHVDDPLARLPLVALEHERTRADDLLRLDRLGRIGLGDALRHDQHR